MESYRLAISQKANYVEQDLQITSDGVLICLHDLTLERTTNVAEVFPTRAVVEDGVRHWRVSDFSLPEIKMLDAGSWFDAKFRGAKVPTWQETIDEVRGKAGLFPETKEPEVYGQRGFDMERLLADSLSHNGLNEPISPSNKTPVIIQSFSPASLKRLTEYRVRVPLVLLIADQSGPLLNEAAMLEIRTYAQGIGPSKHIVQDKPDVVNWAHAAGLSVTPWTFRSKNKTQFSTVTDEMAFFLNTLGVDAVFTDNPDMFPR